MTTENILMAKWGVAGNVKTLITQTNTLSESQDAKFGFNIATHVGDDVALVEQRREQILRHFHLPSKPFWLNQVHGNQVICVEDYAEVELPDADASFTFEPGRVCVVSTADCLPVLVSDSKGSFVAAIHAGWQGLYKGIIKECLDEIRLGASQRAISLGSLHAYIAPAISQRNYQVDQSLFHAFRELNGEFKQCFLPDEPENKKNAAEKAGNKYLADLKAIAKIQLEANGVDHIIDSGICTYDNPDFYSFRRAKNSPDENTQENCGRFASMIWLEKA